MSDPPFVVDLHAHFPMHVDPEQAFRKGLRHSKRRPEKLWDRFTFWGLQLVDRVVNREHCGDGHAVTVATLSEGNVGVALSVAYCPFVELDGLPGAAPRDDHFHYVHDLLEKVERKVRKDPRATVVRDFAQLTAARSAGKVALIHAIEGGFHLGGTDEAIAENVATLAKMGLGYVTVAHLFLREVSTNAPALPFLPDDVYRRFFPQPDSIGLFERGKTLIRAMVKHGVLVDITHMSERGMEDTFALLDELDPGKTIPVLATHIGCSLKTSPGDEGYAYNLSETWVKRVAERKGVCGIMYCEHYLRDEHHPATKSLQDSFALIEEQIAKLRAWGGDDVLAIGSDLDGFIKPTLHGLSSARNHKDLSAWLVGKYGQPLAEKICHGNALRVFESAWRKPFP